jgi:hypothetical protein
MQVDPIEPTLKAPGANLLTLKFDERLSNFAFKFNLCQYSLAGIHAALTHNPAAVTSACLQLATAVVGRRRLTLSVKPMLKPHGTKLLKLKRDEMLSTSAFKFDLRRYTVAAHTVREVALEGAFSAAGAARLAADAAAVAAVFRPYVRKPAVYLKAGMLFIENKNSPEFKSVNRVVSASM